MTVSRDILEQPPTPADSRIAYGADANQFGDLRLPAQVHVPQGTPETGTVPLVVVIHGGFWRDTYSLDHIGHLCAALTAHGFATWSLEYCRLGQRGGGWPGTFQDVAAGLDQVRALVARYPLDLNRVITIGHSAGGHLALWLAARHRLPATSPLWSPNPLPVRGAISLAGVVDLQRAWELRLGRGVVDTLMVGSPAAWPERYAAASPIELLPLGVPQALLHGTLDDIVPFEISQRYVAAAKCLGDPAELIVLEGQGHFEPIDPRSAAWPAVVDAVRQLSE